MSTLPANGQFDSSTLLSTCAPLTASQLDNTGATSTTLLLPFTGSGSNKGLLGNYTSATATGVDPNSYMTFDKLNDPTQRMQWLQTRYATLLAEKAIPIHPQLPSVQNNLITPPNVLDPVATYNTEVASFLQLIGEEFCYYQRNYFIGVNAFLRFYSSASTASSVANNLNLWQQTALTLNEKVNTMISLINYLASMNVANMRSLQSQLMSQTSSITSSTNALQEQADILRDNNKTNALYKQMMDYTEEKNRANKNLLAVYFTLNVVAITCLFIAARSL
jgi:hypothetical protein